MPALSRGRFWLSMVAGWRDEEELAASDVADVTDQEELEKVFSELERLDVLIKQCGHQPASFLPEHFA
jgi:alkanesulfonate monooxygenase SsuD/methylene tetrahydromethanopterin reductase-like flavin-dependent oxidoreductase (luciferase family)